MRFLGIGGSGIAAVSGSSFVKFKSAATLSQLGVIATGVPSVCPASILQCSNGTVLVFTGLGPALRMRYNERRLSIAGVPPPSSAIVLLNGEDYDNEAAAIVDPLTGRPLKNVTFDFTQYGPIYKNYPGPMETVDGKHSFAARNAFVAQYYGQFAAITVAELNLNGDGANNLASARVFNQVRGYYVYPATYNATSVNWVNLTGSFLVYDTTDVPAITGQYQCFQRWVDKDGYVSDPGPLSPLSTLSSKNVVKYTEVEIPTDIRVTRRQIWRNTSGQVQNFYLDIDTDDLTSTEFDSTKTDEQLVLCDLITFTDVDGYTIPYLYGQPPADKPYLAELRGRIFAVGSRRYSEGSVVVTNGSTTVTGIGTNWNTSLVGRRFIAGTKEYLVTAVDVTAQTLTISQGYLGVSDNFAIYVIAPFPADERIIRWTDARGGPEAWPLTAQLLLPQDGDTITGIFNYGDALYITGTRNIYRFNFTEDPAVDGEISPAAKRGCINNRCAVAVEGALLMLDREGIHAFIGGPNPQHISLPVGDLFREETDGLHINWAADLCMLHAILHQELSTVKWYVPLAGDMFPQHSISYDYRRAAFWLESYPRPIASSCYSLAITGRPLLGTTEGKVVAADVGSLDLIAPGGTFMTIAAVNSVFSISLTETPKTCTGVPAVIVNGTAAGVDRIITYQSGTEIQFGTPMDVMPSVGDKVQLGGVSYRFKTAAFNADRMDGNNPKSFSMKFNPNAENLYGTLTVFKNGLSNPSTRAAARSPWGATNRNDKANAKHVTLDLASDLGIVVEQLSFTGEKDVPANLEYQFAVAGSSGEDKPKILEIRVDGAA